MEAGGGEVFGEMRARPGSGDEQDVRREVEQPGEGDLGRGRVQPAASAPSTGFPSIRCCTSPGHPSGQNGTNAMPRAVHSVRTSRDRWSARLNRFCTQAISVWATRLSRCSREMLLRPMPSIRPSSRARTSAASCASNRLPGGSDGSIMRRFTAASLSMPSVARLSSMPWRSCAGRRTAERAAGVAAGGDLAHDRQVRPDRVQRLADEFVDGARAVVLRGVDVVHAGLDRRPQDRSASSRSRAGPKTSSPASCIAP